MPGGTWITQNKVRPGAYINVVSSTMTIRMGGERGVATMPWESGWGTNEVVSITPRTNFLRVLGYEISAPEMLVVRECLKRATTLLLFRINATDGTPATATTDDGLAVTARARGARGNDLSIRIYNDLDDPEYFIVETLMDTTVVDEQRVQTKTELVHNDFVRFDFSGSPNFNPLAGLRLAGGETGDSTLSNYAEYFETIADYDFNCMGITTDDEFVKMLASSFIVRLREDEGKKCQVAIANLRADTEAVINVTNGVILGDRANTEIPPVLATAWVAGATAGARVAQSNTHSAYEGAADVYGKLDHQEIIAALLRGQFVFRQGTKERIIVEQDINSHTTFTVQKNRDFSKNMIIRVLDDIANSIREKFSENFIGRVINNEDGRATFTAVIIDYMDMLEGLGAIENFEEDDVRVERGINRDAVLAHLYVQPTDAMEKLYMIVEVV